MLTPLIRLLPKIDVQEGESFLRGWWGWGNIVPRSTRAPTMVYAFLRLPSWKWEADMYYDRWCWHQLHLLYIACEEGCRQWDSPNHGWRFEWIPERDYA